MGCSIYCHISTSAFSATAPYSLPGWMSLPHGSFGPNPPVMRTNVRNYGIKWNHHVDGQHKTLLVGSSFFILVSTIVSSGKARKKAFESAQKAVLKGPLLKDYQQNWLTLSSVIDNTVGEDHQGLVRSQSNLLKSLNFCCCCCFAPAVTWDVFDIIPNFLKSVILIYHRKEQIVWVHCTPPWSESWLMSLTDDISKRKSIFKGMRVMHAHQCQQSIHFTQRVR